MDFHDPTEEMPYVIEHAISGKELGVAESYDAARLAAYVLAAEEKCSVSIRLRGEAPGWCGECEVDERWLRQWVDFGISEIERVLANDARYRDWCRRTGREP